MNDRTRKRVWLLAYGVLTDELNESLEAQLEEAADAAACEAGLRHEEAANEVQLIISALTRSLRDGPSRETIYESAKSAILPLVDCDEARATQIAHEILSEAANTSESFCWWDN